MAQPILSIISPHQGIPAFKAARCDLLVGNIRYECGHEFSTLLNYSLKRVGERGHTQHQCPNCAEEGRCLVCLQSWDPAAADSCTGCDTFFVHEALYARLVRLHTVGLTVRDDKPELFVLERLRAKDLKRRRADYLARL